jgi:hypothetical protein
MPNQDVSPVTIREILRWIRNMEFETQCRESKVLMSLRQESR